jgi:hypothetical protein
MKQGPTKVDFIYQGDALGDGQSAIPEYTNVCPTRRGRGALKKK